MRCTLLIFFICAVLSTTANACQSPDVTLKEIQSRGLVVKGPISPAEAEQENVMPFDVESQTKATPFGRLNADWVSFKQGRKSTDRIYFISSSPKQWEVPLSGAFKGYGIVRDGCVINFFRTAIS
jgi:hypothetical protein